MKKVAKIEKEYKKKNKKSFEDIQKELNLVPKMSTEEIKIEGSKDHKEESPIDKLKRELQKELKNNNTNKKNTKTTRKAPRKTSMNNDFVDFLILKLFLFLLLELLTFLHLKNI
jgi:cation transport ATPase